MKMQRLEGPARRGGAGGRTAWLMALLILGMILPSLTRVPDAAAQQQQIQDPESETPQSQNSLQKGWTAPTGGGGDADIARGEQLWGKCQACHTYREGARHSVGPNLYGVLGRRAGMAEGYNYSKAMRDSDVIWTDENLKSYLAATQDFMPGSKMYGGLAIARDRVDLLAWLKTVAVE